MKYCIKRMNIHTIEQNFEYQMVAVIERVLRSYDKSPSDFKDGDELMKFLWDERGDFGRYVFEAMNSYMEDDDWLKEIKEN